MIIGIDGNEANVHKRVGINEYAFQLLSQFSKTSHFAEASRDKQNLKFIIYLKDKPLKDLPPETENWKYKVVGPKKFWTQFGLPFDLYISRSRPDVFFSATHYAPRFSPVPTVVSVMDLSFLYFPELFKKSDLYQLKSWTSYSVKNAEKVLAISNSTKNDIIKEYKIPEARVKTVYLGIRDTISLEPHVYGMNQLKAKYNISDNYILFVGTLQPRKNISRLIEAFNKVLSIKYKVSSIDDLQLVVIGKKGWLYEEILAKPKELGIENRVKFLHGVSDDELAIFYKHAKCYVLPSLYEGFGLPVLEAMKHECPVITSKISSLPEAGGDAALYVDPENADDIAEKIEKLITDEKLRQELIAKGKKQVEKFSWEKTSRETLDILMEVGEKK